jgi:hypothetical protein
MRTIARAWIVVVLLAAPALAAGAVERTYNAPADQVWDKTLAVLKILGWDIDKSDHSIGFIVTDSRRV